MTLLTTTLALTAIIAVRYLAIAGTAHALLWRRGAPRFHVARLGQATPQARDRRREMWTSLAASPIYALPAAVALVAWTHGQGRIYGDPQRYGLWWLPASALIYLLVQDAYYYWLHRAMHHPRLFGWMHRGHHLSREPTAFASFAFDLTEAAATAWLLPALSFLVPIHVGVALGLLMLMTLTATLNHCGFELLPARWVRGPVGGWVISATHHSLHHARFRCNYGLHLRLWDRLMGTDAMPGLREAP